MTTPSPHEEPLTSADDAGDAGQGDEDAEEQEGDARNEPSDHSLPIHGTAPASSLPTDSQNNEPQVPEVPFAANDNPAPAELPATAAE
jgi:hypothetical protein